MDNAEATSVRSSNSTQPSLVQDDLEAKDSRGSSSSSGDSDTAHNNLLGFATDPLEDEDKTKDESDVSDDRDIEKYDNVDTVQDGDPDESPEELEQEEEESEIGNEIFENEEEEYEEETVAKPAPINTNLPKMRSRFAMSNQQIRDFIDPDNQKDFNDNIMKINELLEATKKEYCLKMSKPGKSQGKEFKLRRDLLAELVYDGGLDLGGNFLQQTVGRRLNDGDMQVLLDFLLSEKTVSRLNLAYNDFTDEPLVKLAEVLVKRINILHLDLTHNNMTSEGCIKFSDILMQRPILHSLKLSGMKIGDTGFDGLICLIMCGKCCYDLDISETDMGVAAFQGLCTALEAIDKEEDFPKYLLSHPLPTPLEHLAGFKRANNDYRRKQDNLQSRRSVVRLVEYNSRTKPKVKANGDGDGVAVQSALSRQSGGGGGVSNDIIVTEASKKKDPVRLMEKISATILEGLFEIPELNAQSYPKTKTLIQGDEGKLKKIVEEAKAIPETELIIKEYHSIKETGCVQFEPDGKPVIVCPSLYSLDVDDVLQSHTSHKKNGERTSHFIPGPLDEVMEGGKPETAKEGRSANSPNDESANKASEKIVSRAIKEAAQFASTTDYGDKSNAAQMLLSTVLETCQKLMDTEDSKGEFQEQELQAIWDTATEYAMKIIQGRVPPAHCAMTQNGLRDFVRKFVESTNRTILHLLRNPFVPSLLIDVATKPCRGDLGGDQSRPHYPPGSSANLEPNIVYKIVTNFLEGAISEAAHLIGTGDPFHFRRKHHEHLPDLLQTAKDACDQAEGHAQVVLDDFFLAGALLGQASIQSKEELQLLDGTTDEPATDFLEYLFDKVAELIIETQQADIAAAAEGPPEKFPYVARPYRLVLNRPLFQDFEAIMAGKLAEFLRTNKTVKVLHIRKWNLGEDGMINLMDGLGFNRNIVLLDLGSNSIGGEGCKALAQFVRQNKNLRHLLLNHNNLRNPGIMYLTEAFPESNLQFLNISYNDITDEGLDPLFQLLPQTKIKGLYAIGNKFSQTTWKLAKDLFDSKAVVPEFCDFTLQEVDGKGMIVKNSQIRETNEWYGCHPLVANGLYRAPYFEEDAHIRNLPEEHN